MKKKTRKNVTSLTWESRSAILCSISNQNQNLISFESIIFFLYFENETSSYCFGNTYESVLWTLLQVDFEMCIFALHASDFMSNIPFFYLHSQKILFWERESVFCPSEGSWFWKINIQFALQTAYIWFDEHRFLHEQICVSLQNLWIFCLHFKTATAWTDTERKIATHGNKGMCCQNDCVSSMTECMDYFCQNILKTINTMIQRQKTIRFLNK